MGLAISSLEASTKGLGDLNEHLIGGELAWSPQEGGTTTCNNRDSKSQEVKIVLAVLPHAIPGNEL